jgi:hypothetical protein
MVSLQDNGSLHRKVLSQYSLIFIDQIIASLSAATIMSYCIYGFSSSTAQKTPYLMLTIPFVIYGVFRYMFLVYNKGFGGEPERVFLSDKPLQLNILFWIIASGAILYLT